MGVVRDFIPEGEELEAKKPFVDFIPDQAQPETVSEEVLETKKEEVTEKRSRLQEIKDAFTGAEKFKEVIE